MFDYSYFSGLSETEEKQKYLKKCIAEADREQDWKSAFDLRYKYIKESCFNDDKFKGIVMFPELMSVFDEHKDEIHNGEHTLMIAFKWIVEDVTDFPEVSKEMSDKYFDEFRKRSIEYGYSLRTYYMKIMTFYTMIDFPKALEYQKLFRESKRDDISDCHACELSNDIKLELEYGSEEKAIKMLHDMNRRNLSCAEVPEVTYGKCVEHFTRTGHIEEAEHYANMLYPMIKDKGGFLEELSNIMLIKTVTEPNMAFNVFKRCLPQYIRMKNQRMRFHFANAAWRFFDTVSKNGQETLSMNLPKHFELYNKENEYKSGELAEYFHSQAAEIAERFDKRNGSTYYTDNLNYEYPTEPIKKLDLPAHGTEPKAPFMIGIPFINTENIPSPDQIIETVRLIDDFEYKGSAMSEDNMLLLQVYNKFSDNEMVFRIVPDEISEFNEFRPAQVISDSDLQKVTEDYSAMLAIITPFGKKCEGKEYNSLMKLVIALNHDESPAFLDFTTRRFINADWAAIQSESQVSPIDINMYRIYVYFSEHHENKIDMHTAGLEIFGTRNLAVIGIDEENVPAVRQILEQITKDICCFGNLCDSGEKTECGIIYNNKNRVRFSWKTVSEVYSEYKNEGFGELAAPMLHLKGNAKGIPLNDLTAEQLGLLDFSRSNIQAHTEETKANETFKYAVSAFRKDENSALIVGFDAEIKYIDNEEDEDDVYYVTVYAEAVHSDSEKLMGTVQQTEDDEEIKEGSLTTINPETVFFWRLEKNGEYYFADDSYLL